MKRYADATLSKSCWKLRYVIPYRARIHMFCIVNKDK